MCSIMVYCGTSAKKIEFEKGFYKTESRGPDQTKIIELKKGLMGFHRLAIMGLDERGMQPFQLKENYIVCNGEIYEYKSLIKKLTCKYQFKSDSDCEVLLPLFQEYGIDMFKMLDGEYALVIFDGKSGDYIAARDPLGIRPLYYSYDKEGTIWFASEPKNLVETKTQIYPFPPGHYYKDNQFICFNDVTAVNQFIENDIEVVCKNIKEKLICAVEKRMVADAKVAYLLSGGLDSSLVCSIASKVSCKPLVTFSIGMSEDAIDLKYAREVANFIRSDHYEVIITKNDVLDIVEEVIAVCGSYDITTIRASIGMYLLCKYIHENSEYKVLLTGEVSDELFGYKYTDFAPDEMAFQKESQKRIKELHMYDVLRADRCISANSLEARVPFGDIDFVSYVMSIHPSLKRNTYNMGKYLLRHAFDNGEYLPHNILFREKAAFSDAVGHSMVEYLIEYANQRYTDEQFNEYKEKYGLPIPFTKEALYYREIFEKYYPKQKNLIKDYWMPNKEWLGCDVNDPSARFLSNYGNSGK